MIRTVYNCSIIKKQVKRDIGEPERYYMIKRCLGYAKSDNDDEPREDCKNASCIFVSKSEKE